MSSVLSLRLAASQVSYLLLTASAPHHCGPFLLPLSASKSQLGHSRVQTLKFKSVQPAILVVVLKMTRDDWLYVMLQLGLCSNHLINISQNWFQHWFLVTGCRRNLVLTASLKATKHQSISSTVLMHFLLTFHLFCSLDLE